MTEFVFGKNRIKVDVERTGDWYSAHEELEQRCTCVYCRNFHAALPLLPKKVRQFLEPLGLTLERPAEIMEWCKEADGRHWYTALYHLAGELLEEGAEPLGIAPDVTVNFLTERGPFLENFPEPFFQLFLDVRLPWVLEKADT